jgi:N-acetylmuramoyl-L-alanine amidase
VPQWKILRSRFTAFIFSLCLPMIFRYLSSVRRIMLSTPWLVAGFAILSVCCSPVAPVRGGSDRAIEWANRDGGATSSGSGGASMSKLVRQINLKQDMVRAGTCGRRVVRRMKPRYITIHSTQNYSADAWQHSLALKRGALRAPKRLGGNRIGYLIWHFTVDDRVAVQHMPTNEQGEHADFNGPGNNYSIGIEMCEQRGSNLNATMDRTAKLAAYLMVRNGIPLRNVVPHYHWPRRGCNPPNKNCPHFLMDNGRPGRKWNAFLGRINYYFARMRG